MFWKRGIRESLGDVAGACYCMAAIDGEVTQDELVMIRNALIEFSDGAESPETIQQRITDAGQQVAEHGVDGYLGRVGKRLDDTARELVLAATGATLMADGKVHDRERALFLALAERFGFSLSDAGELLERVIAAARDDAG